MRKLILLIAALAILAIFLAGEETKYTNESVARLSFVNGETFIQRASDLGYEEGELNSPVSEGDRIGTTDGRAEVHLGRRNYIRLDANTKIDVLNLPKKGNDFIRLRIWSGSIYLEVGSLEKEKSIEIHSADTSFYILDKGIYRIDVKENEGTDVSVFRGLIEAAGEEGSTLVKSEQRLEVSEGRFTSRPASFMAVADDSFDSWNESRRSELSQIAARRYLPAEMEDYESELDRNGEWVYMAPYGYVWVPSGMEADWRPYWHGRWVWLPMTGWTWLPYEPWGWATSHYGRWHWGVGVGWYWIPTSLWGPAWVSWWWDYDYYAWAPMGWWGYPVAVIDGRFYGRYWDHYPAGSRALTVIRRDQLKAPNISRVALRDESMKSLDKINLSSPSLTLRPTGEKVSVRSLDGKRLLLRKDNSSATVKPDKGSETREQGKPESSLSRGKSAKPPASEAPKGGKERKIRKKDGEPSSEGLGLSQGSARPASGLDEGAKNLNPRTVHGYPSSPAVSGRLIREEGRESGSLLGRFYRYISGDDSSKVSSSRSRTSSSSSSRVSSRSGSSSRSTSRSSGRVSSSSRSGSRSSGSVRKKG